MKLLHFRINGSGSSPRMRGTPMTFHGSYTEAGIIPAYAGNTTSRPCPCRARRDHPRVCGEHGKKCEQMFMEEGSSPRMRGTPSACACATWSARDHPRVCGEHVDCRVARAHLRGSSPRMRGTQSPASQPLRKSGSSPRMRGTLASGITADEKRVIIPAYAGNTSSLRKSMF